MWLRATWSSTREDVFQARTPALVSHVATPAQVKFSKDSYRYNRHSSTQKLGERYKDMINEIRSDVCKALTMSATCKKKKKLDVDLVTRF